MGRWRAWRHQSPPRGRAHRRSWLSRGPHLPLAGLPPWVRLPGWPGPVGPALDGCSLRMLDPEMEVNRPASDSRARDLAGDRRLASAVSRHVHGVRMAARSRGTRRLRVQHRFNDHAVATLALQLAVPAVGADFTEPAADTPCEPCRVLGEEPRHGLPETHTACCAFVDKILRGAKPADLAIEQPRKSSCLMRPSVARVAKVRPRNVDPDGGGKDRRPAAREAVGRAGARKARTRAGVAPRLRRTTQRPVFVRGKPSKASSLRSSSRLEGRDVCRPPGIRAGSLSVRRL